MERPRTFLHPTNLMYPVRTLAPAAALSNASLVLVFKPSPAAALGGIECLGWAVWRRRESIRRVRP